jgi:hypothetical protein
VGSDRQIRTIEGDSQASVTQELLAMKASLNTRPVGHGGGAEAIGRGPDHALDIICP